MPKLRIPEQDNTPAAVLEKVKIHYPTIARRPYYSALFQLNIEQIEEIINYAHAKGQEQARNSNRFAK